jgi:hypothetical protein
MPTSGVGDLDLTRSGMREAPRFAGWIGFALLLVAEWKLRRGGCDRVVEMLTKRPVRNRPAAAVDPMAVSEALDAVILYYFRRPTCLHRSVALVALLRRYGVPAELVIGAVRAPFFAHAWVEIARVPLGERKPVDDYAELVRC